jgi:hypothetical protein
MQRLQGLPEGHQALKKFDASYARLVTCVENLDVADITQNCLKALDDLVTNANSFAA